MDLRAKLSRLKKLRTEPDAVPADEPPVMTEAPAGAPHLADLRARLAELIDRSRAREDRKRVERAAEIEARLRAVPLPFDEHETEHGPLHVRFVRHAPSHRVGRIPLRVALDADPKALALLALDETIATVDPRRALYIDTEATGLAGGTGTIPFLVGIAWYDGDDLVVEQLLLRRLGEETPILVRLAERLAAASVIVSFNGKSFDLPLLRTRYVMNRMPPPPEPPHLDLVHLARRVHRSTRGRGGVGDPRSGPVIERMTAVGHDGSGDEELRRATSCKLVALERQILGFARVDDVPSAEVPARYGHFLRTGDADAILSVCDHNLWDVISMAALVGVYADAVRGLDDASELPPLGGRDMVGIARTLQRAGDLPRARRAADAAVCVAEGDSDLDVLARHTRGGIAKGARDVARAQLDFEHLAREHGDAAARLELAKLYEHRLRDPERALSIVAEGTTEEAERAAHRHARLTRKVDRTRQLALVPKRRRPNGGS